jgi:ferric-dicitrate binding protein FerR (iron transport regulator)
MNNESIWKQITGKLTGETAADQDEAVDQWLASDRVNRGTFSRLGEIWNYNPTGDQDTSGIYRRVRERIARGQRIGRLQHLVYYTLRISAIVFLLAGTTVLIQMITGQRQERRTALNEIFVPRGSRTSIVLPDSSRVWLSNQSKLIYPGTFQGDLREVELTGEAYFEVARSSKSKPFIVRFGKNRIRVLGTKFSVTAYPDDPIVKAELISGKVMLDIQKGKQYQSVEMKPGQSLSYNKGTQTIVEGAVDAGFYDYWLKGVYTFRDETLESLARKAARIYNMEIVFGDEQLKSKRYSGSFSVDDNLYNFIEAIRQTSVDPVEYKMEKNKLYLYLTKR